MFQYVNEWYLPPNVIERAPLYDITRCTCITNSRQDVIDVLFLTKHLFLHEYETGIEKTHVQTLDPAVGTGHVVHVQ